MNLPPQTDPRAKRWGVFAKYAALLGVGLIVAPYIFTAITGLVGLAVAGALILGTWMVLPSVEAAAANMRLKLIKGEAARNPIETLQNDLREKTLALDGRKVAIQQLNGKIRTFADKVEGIRAKYGVKDPDYIKLSADLVELKRLSAHQVEKWNEAQNQLVRYSESIERGSMIWDAAQAAAAARQSSGLTEKDFFARLRSETAFDAIQTSYNEALSSLDTMLMDGDRKQIATPSPVEDSTPRVSQKTPIT